VLTGGLAAGLAVLVADWVVWLPPGVRLTAALGLVIGLAVAAIRWVLHPLRRPIPLDDIAQRVEQRFRLPSDALRSAANFAQGCGTGAASLTRHVLAEAEDALRGLCLGDVITRRPLLLRAARLAGVVSVVSVLWIGRPEWVRTGVARLADPLGPTQWPRAVEIEMRTGAATVAVGDSLPVRMRVVRGDRPSLRPLLHIRDTGGSRATFSMQAAEDGEYVCSIPAVAADLSYWAEAGDATTVDRPVHVRAVRRPAVVQARALVLPPAYVPAEWEREYDLTTAPAKAVPGSEVTVCFRFSKPVGQGDTGEPKAALVFPNDDRLPLLASPNDDDAFCAIFESADDFAFRVHVEDAEGFENRDGREYRIRAAADQPPAVVIERPQSLVEVTPNGTVPVTVRAEDDFGLGPVWLSAAVNDASAPRTIDLADVTETEVAADRVQARAALEWSMRSLGVQAGDNVVYRAAALDNRRLADAGPQTGESAALRLRIISHDAFRRRLREEFQLLEGRVRQALGEQETLTDRVRSSGSDADAEERSSVLRSAAGTQDRLARRIGEMSDRLQLLHDEMDRNRFDDAAARRRAGQAGGQLRSAATGPMKDAAAELAQAARMEPAAERNRLLTQALERQEETAAGLRSALEALGQWGDYEEIVNRTRQMLDQQQAVRTQTADIGRETLGQSVDTLPAERRLVLERVTRDQGRLAEDLEHLLEQIRHLAESTAADGEDAALQKRSLDSAAQTAVRQNVSERMRQAARAVEENRTSAAGVEQQAAEAGLSTMLDALLNRMQPQAPDATEGLTQLAQQLRDLIRSQQQLLDATAEAASSAGDAAARNRLADLQAGLAGETQKLAAACDTAAATDPSIANRVSDAGKSMQRAESDLRSDRASAATDAQKEAVDRLNRALTAAQRLADQLRAEAAARSVLALRTELEDLRTQQQTIADGASELARAARDAERLSRADARKAGRLAQAQEDARGQGAGILERMGPAVTFRWLMTRILADMTQSRDQFQQRQIDETLTAGQERILSDLGRLIDAFEQLAALPPPGDSAPQAEAGDKPGALPPPEGGVPAAAELLLVRALQLDLNARTRKAAEQMGQEPPSEAQLQQIHDLGRQQQELQALMQLLIEQAQKGRN